MQIPRISTGKASPVGDKPGVTRAVMTSIRVSNNPLVYLVDTPGIMVPNISDMHVGLKLALCCKHFLVRPLEASSG